MLEINNSEITNLAVLSLILLSFYVFLKWFTFPILKKLAKKTSTLIDDLLLDKKFVHRISFVFVFILFKIITVTSGYQLNIFLNPIFQRIFNAFFALTIGLTILEILTVVNKISEKIDFLRDKPIKGYIQIIKIIITSFVLIIIFALLTGQSVGYYISGLGALTAVLLLIFQDTILSFVASVQISQNDIIKVGDWIEVKEFGADGDVVDIALHTVKVQNWDKTITTIPTSKIVNTSVKNWRAMSDYGGRRIKRAINIDISSIKFLSDAELANLELLPPLKNYLLIKREELKEYNIKINDVDSGLEKRKLTNIGTYRAYIENYLKQNKNLNTESMTFLIRQLPSSPEGVPLEIYTFTNTTEWVAYEKIQSDIFDHLFAILPKFGLRAYQNGLLEAVAMKNLPFHQLED
ncbi:MAG: mechanosensitive ion channel [Actinomycetota bacterium]|nr:mechanosensitive ion channel [Actinomycetota bacterium]